MAALRFTELQSRPLEFLDFTSLTLDEFQHLVPPFEAAFHARMAAWRMDGKPRTARRFTVDKNGSFQISVDSFSESPGSGRMAIILLNRHDSSPSTTHQRLHDEVYQTPRFRSAHPY